MISTCQTTSIGIGSKNLQYENTSNNFNFNYKVKSKIKYNVIEALNLNYIYSFLLIY
jgi:hypothetical protein